MHEIATPIKISDVANFKVGDIVSLSGEIYCGRDAVLPRVVRMYHDGKLGDSGIHLDGSLIFHTAVSPAGTGPTSSNKLEIESSIAPLSEAGVRIHLGKGIIGKATVDALDKYNSVFAVIPPVTALLNSNILETNLVAFPEEGMEAFYMLKVHQLTMIIAAAHGQAIWSKDNI